MHVKYMKECRIFLWVSTLDIYRILCVVSPPSLLSGDILSPEFTWLLQGLTCSSMTCPAGHCQWVLGRPWPKLGQSVPHFWMWEWRRVTNLSQFAQNFPSFSPKFPCPGKPFSSQQSKAIGCPGPERALKPVPLCDWSSKPVWSRKNVLMGKLWQRREMEREIPTSSLHFPCSPHEPSSKPTSHCIALFADVY